MFIQRPGNTGKRHYRYYVCAKRVEDRSCAQPYIPAARLEGAVIGKIQELSTRPDLIQPFLAREIKRRKAASRDRERRARRLERRMADLETRQGRLVDWLAETLPGKAAARKLNEKIERLEEEKGALAEERAGIERRGDENLDGVTAEAVARHLAEFGYYLDQFNAGQRKEAPGGGGGERHRRGTDLRPPYGSICRSRHSDGSTRPVQNGVRYGEPNRIRTWLLDCVFPGVLRLGQSEDGPCTFDSLDQPSQVLLSIVQVERGSSGSRYAESPHQRLAAVVARADRNAFVIEDGGEVVGMDVGQRKRDHAGAGDFGAWTVEPDVLELGR
jgi:hypothetical protein